MSLVLITPLCILSPPVTPRNAPSRRNPTADPIAGIGYLPGMYPAGKILSNKKYSKFKSLL
jgi:hypothetical protein